MNPLRTTGGASYKRRSTGPSKTLALARDPVDSDRETQYIMRYRGFFHGPAHKSCRQETLPRDPTHRSCQETLCKDLAQRSCKTAPIHISRWRFVEGPLKRSRADPVKGSVHKSCQEIQPKNRASRSGQEILQEILRRDPATIRRYLALVFLEILPRGLAQDLQRFPSSYRR